MAVGANDLTFGLAGSAESEAMRPLDLPPETHYRIKLISDSKKHGQDRSLPTLACFAVDLIQIETL